ncbi:MAG: hypothetical protein ACI4QT_09820 [Kiritimatiellia bacterium]
MKTKRDARGFLYVLLLSDADSRYYDYPLTLETQVPPAWKKALVVQDMMVSTVDVKNCKIRYRAVPGKETIRIKEAK